MSQKPSKPVPAPEIRRSPEPDSPDPLLKWKGRTIHISTRGGDLEGILLYVTRYTLGILGCPGKSNPYGGYSDEKSEFVVYKSAINFVRCGEKEVLG